MRTAIFSDLHGNAAAFEQVLRDAEARGVERLICLGDVGHDPRLLLRLRQLGVECTFGNWEVGGLRRMPATVASWVAGWPACIYGRDAVYCHATPDMPPGAATTATAVNCLRHGVGAAALFPRLHYADEALWAALAVLEELDRRVAFHGHTHVQKVWAWRAGSGDRDRRRLEELGAPAELLLDSGPAGEPARYVIGVGSAGQPQDGPVGRYVVYDEDAQRVVLCWLAA